MEIRDKHAFSEAVDDLIAQNIEDRTERIAAVHALTEAYTDSTGVRPDGVQLERLADYILREELTDPDPYKVANSEYPFLSERQLELRRKREVPLKVAEETGTDGKNYVRPRRRKRSRYENWYVDYAVKLRNKERAAQYKRDTAPGPVVNIPSEPFVNCRGIGAKIREWSGV